MIISNTFALPMAYYTYDGFVSAARKLIYFFLLFTAQHVVGQKDYEIDLRKCVADLHLDGYHVEKLCIVLDDTTYIGYAQTGLGNVKTPARFKSGIRSELSAFLLRLRDPDAKSKPLTLRINKLYIYELTYTSNELSFITLNVSFLEKGRSGWIELFQAAVSFNRSGMDVTGQHDDNIARAFQQCFFDFNDRMKQGKIIPHEIPDSALLLNPLLNNHYFPVSNINSFSKKAIYHSFYDFRDGFPDTLTPFAVKVKTDETDSIVASATLHLSGDTNMVAPWGFSDGSKHYLRIGKRYYPIQIQGGEFVSDIAPKDLSSDIATGVIVAGVAGGILGAALASGIAALASSSRESVEHGKFRLDFSTRTLIPLNAPDFLEIRSHLLFYLSRVSASALPVCIFVDDVFHAKLEPGDYYELSLPSDFKEISVAFMTVDGIRHIKTYTPTLYQTYVYLIRVKKNRSIVVGTTFGDVRRDILLEQSVENTVTRTTSLNSSGSCQ